MSWHEWDGCWAAGCLAHNTVSAGCVRVHTNPVPCDVRTSGAGRCERAGLWHDQVQYKAVSFFFLFLLANEESNCFWSSQMVCCSVSQFECWTQFVSEERYNVWRISEWKWSILFHSVHHILLSESEIIQWKYTQAQHIIKIILDSCFKSACTKCFGLNGFELICRCLWKHL